MSLIEEILGFLKLVGETDSASGAIFLAVVTALLTAAGWLAIRIVDVLVGIGRWLHGVNRARHERRAAIIRFYLDVKIRIHSCETAFSDAAKVGYADMISRSRKDFRAYVENTDDNSPNQGMNELLHTLRPAEMPLIRNYIIHDDLFGRQYIRTRTDEFAALSTDRKVAVANALFASASNVQRIGKMVVKALNSHRYIAKLNVEIDAMLAGLQTPDFPRAGEAPKATVVKAAEEADRTSGDP